MLKTERIKPLMRGYIHQVAFFIALGACSILITQSYGSRALTANIIYSLSLIGLYGISALYHCPLWSRRTYLLLKRIDHAAIFTLIAGTATPICLLGLHNASGWHLLLLSWTAAAVGMLIAVCWIHGAKWFRASLYIITGWLTVTYLPDIEFSLGSKDTWLLLTGGIIYTIGAMIYSFRRPNPFPKIFGYHEIFHILVVIASGFHFAVVYSLVHQF